MILAPCRARTWLLPALVVLLVLVPRPAPAAVDAETLAGRIAESLKTNLQDPHYRTVAISRIKNNGANYNTDELIDFTNVKIVRTRRLKVLDRSKLQLILKEQRIQLSDFISSQKYQELGQLLGVDLFIYGTFYSDALVLKGIDVQNSAIAWADIFPLRDQLDESAYLLSLGDGMIKSLRKDADRLRQAGIKLVSFWDFDVDGSFSPEAVMDFLSVAVTRDGTFKVVDRENLKLITKEQQLNQSVFIDEQNAKRLGELYGVDGFIYGSVTRRPDKTLLGSLKLLNIYNGVIEWADLIRMDRESGEGTAATAPAAEGPSGMVNVPGGISLMGSGDATQVTGPLHQVKLSAYYIDEYEVSNQDYEAFVKERNHRAPVGWAGTSFPAGQGAFPVVGITWEDARQYCRFAGKRLPKEAEWERAARGVKGQTYPWAGTAFSPAYTVTRESGAKGPVKVTDVRRDVSPTGAKFMAGNVREWVEDVFNRYPGSVAVEDAFGRERVVRGGSWATSQRAATTYYRGSSNPKLAWQDVGFRCARSAE